MVGSVVVAVLKREQGTIDPSSPEHMDDCGLRYHLAARHHVYLLNTLPIRQRAQLQRVGLSPANYVWAFHSEAEQVRGESTRAAVTRNVKFSRGACYVASMPT